MDKKYELSIYKEVLNEYAAGMSANYFSATMKMGVERDKTHPFKIKEIKTFRLRDTIRGAETMEELEAISNKLLEYYRELGEFMAAQTIER